jgi:hypothetical protein
VPANFDPERWQAGARPANNPNALTIAAPPRAGTKPTSFTPPAGAPAPVPKRPAGYRPAGAGATDRRGAPSPKPRPGQAGTRRPSAPAPQPSVDLAKGPPAGFQIPSWFPKGATPQETWTNYQAWLRKNPTARGNQVLNRLTGGQWGSAAPKPPTPAGPITPPPMGGSGPGGALGQKPWGGPPIGFPGQVPMPYAFNDPFQMFLSAVPLMNANRDKQIADAMSVAGFSGNRIGTAAANDAMRIGAETALAQDQMLLGLLGDYANNVENRALQANQQGIQLGGLLNSIQQDQLMIPFQIGAWEQGRQDNFANTAFQDWSANRLGWFPHLLQAAMSQGAGSPGQIYTTTEPGKPGAVDWLTALGPLFSAFT